MHRKKPDVTFKTYSEEELRNWNKQIKILPEEIKKREEQLLREQSRLKNEEALFAKWVETNVTPREKIITPIKSQTQVIKLEPEINELEKRRGPLELQIKNHGQSLAAINGKIQSLAEPIKRFESYLNIKAHTKELKILNDAKLANLHQMTQLTREIEDLELFINKNNRSITSIENELNFMLAKQAGSYSSSQSYSSTLSSKQDDMSSTQSSSYSSSINPNENTIEGLRFELAKIIKIQQDLINKKNILTNEKNDLGLENVEIKAKISSLQTKLTIYSEETVTLAESQKASDLASQLKNLKNRRNKYLEEISKEESTLRVYDSKLNALNNAIENKQNELIHARSLAGSAANNFNLMELEENLAVLEKDLNPYLELQEGKLEAIAKINHRIEAEKTEISQLISKLQDLKDDQFVKEFWHTPQTLIDNLTLSLHQTLKTYESQHPAGQSDAVRLCLANLKNHTKQIIALTPNQKPMTYEDLINPDDTFFKQTKYLQLCGLLWAQFNLISSTKEIDLAQIELLDTLILTLNKHQMDETWAIREYETAKLVNLTIAEVQENERSQFYTAYQAFKNLTLLDPGQNKVDRNLSKSAYFLLRQIDGKKEDPHFDYKYYTKILKAARELGNEPDNINFQSKFQNLINHTDDGQPSKARKIFGAGLMFLGAAVAVGATITAMLLPASAPLAIVIGSIGAGLFFIGSAIAISGLEKGLHKRMSQYSEASAHSTLFAKRRPSAESPPVLEQKAQFIPA
ncbi:MAG: hypothetical protein H0W64_00255 [Gammaproteobacteria bacterium]|nr:hypothetical protein [Gammaproteobacteria bacterium]